MHPLVQSNIPSTGFVVAEKYILSVIQQKLQFDLAANIRVDYWVCMHIRKYVPYLVSKYFIKVILPS